MRWVTFFPNLKREHLTKDVGLLPLYMHHNAFDSTLLTTGFYTDFKNIPKEVQNLKIQVLIDKGKLFFLEKAFLDYLDSQAAQIDVLHLFHFNRDTILYGLKYKKKNPKGYLYIKLDAYNQHLNHRKVFSKNPIKDWLMQIRVRQFHKIVDLFTIENTEGKAIAERTYPEWKGKLDYLPNGCNDLFLEDLPFKGLEKEKIVLSVGRLGSSDKNYDLFIKALPIISESGWKFRIVGPISDDFSVLIADFLKANPEFSEKVEFTGAITDRVKLYQEYARAKVFFLTSRFESFGIAYAEAIYFGNVIVGHKGMAAFDDLSAQGNYGAYFKDNDVESFAQSLVNAMIKSGEPHIQSRIRQHTELNFFWSNLGRRLSSRIRNE